MIFVIGSLVFFSKLFHFAQKVLAWLLFSWLNLQSTVVEGKISSILRWSTLQKSVKLAILLFLQKKSLYMVVDKVTKYHRTWAPVNPPITGPKGENTRTSITISDDLLLPL